MNISEIIKACRKEKGLSRYALAKQCEMDYKNLFSIENGADCTFSTAERILGVLGLEIGVKKVRGSRILSLIGWIDYSEEKPQIGEEVLAYHPSFVDDDYNMDGVRVGWRDDKGTFTCAYWDADKNVYMTAMNVIPTLWRPLTSLTKDLPKE